jgi:glutamine amidotransferase
MSRIGETSCPPSRDLRVAVVDCGSGNLASVRRALDRAADRCAISLRTEVTRDPAVVADADRIVLPGQGAFAACMRGLTAIPGLAYAMEEGARRRSVPLLGICVGMQILAQRGLEHGVTDGLGWIRGEIGPLTPRAENGGALPLPQMGWNTLSFPAAGEEVHPLLAGLGTGPHVYFVHSFALTGGDSAEAIATTEYGGPVVAMVASGNIAGTQFHVEKSGETGLTILANFLRWSP